MRRVTFESVSSLSDELINLRRVHRETTTRFVQIETLPVSGRGHIEVPHSLPELENVLAGRERTDDGENSRAGFGVR